MTTPYPWIIDSKYGTTPSIVDYLQVIAPNGLYLNSTTSGTNSNAIFMTGYVAGSSYNTSSSVYYYADKVYYYNVNSLLGVNSSVTYQTSDSGTRPTIFSVNENIIIVSNLTSGYPSYAGSGSINLWASGGLYLNGSPVGGGIAQITSSDGSINVSNPYGPTVDITTSGGGGGVSSVNTGGLGQSGLYVSPTTGSVNVDINIQSGSGISVVNNGGGNWTINNSASGNGLNYLTAGSGISVNNYGYYADVTNTGVITLQGSGSTTVTNLGNGLWDIYSSGGGGGGGDVYWNQLISTTTTYQYLYNASGNYNINFGIDASTYGYADVAKLCIDNTYFSYIGYNYPSTYPDGTYKAGYLKVGYDDNNYTLVTNTSNGYPTTMATIGSDMYLFANKQQYNQNGNGRIYLYANAVLPGNGGGASDLGDNSYYWANVYAANYPSPSDIKLKDNITQLDLAYSTNLIKNLNPVSYTFKSDKDSKKRFGLIAQEVEQIIGSENLQLCLSNNETKSLSYMELISPLIKTVQHLLQKVEDLETQIKELKN